MASSRRIPPALGGLVVLGAIVSVVLETAACGDDPPVTPHEGEDRDASEPSLPPLTSDGGGGSGGFLIEVDCPIGTAVELEDNNTPETANEFGELSFCGAISPASDTDYSKFKTPAGKKLTLFQAAIDGKVDFDLMLNGKNLRPADVKLFEAGEYVVKAYTTDGKPGKYRYRIQFEP